MWPSNSERGLSVKFKECIIYYHIRYDLAVNKLKPYAKIGAAQVYVIIYRPFFFTLVYGVNVILKAKYLVPESPNCPFLKGATSAPLSNAGGYSDVNT